MHHYKFRLSFRVHHPTVLSAKIVALIGKKPDVRWDVGSQRMTPKGNLLDGVYDSTYCCFPVSEGLDSTLIGSIRSWNRFLSTKKSGLDELKRSGGRFDYFLGIFIDSNAGLVIPPEVMREVGELGIELGLDMYESEPTRQRRAGSEK